MEAPALLPACTFPPLAWFRMAQTPGAQVCVHENYVKQSLRNRVALVDAQGPKELTLPVHRRSAPSRSLADIRFTANVSPELLLKVLRTNCGSSPFFDHYFPDVEDWANEHLHEGNSWLEAALASTRWGCDMLGWAHPETTQTFTKGDSWDDWRPKTRWAQMDEVRYPQVFEDRLGFVGGRSILDVLFHVGPETPFLPSPYGNSDPSSHGAASRTHPGRS